MMMMTMIALEAMLLTASVVYSEVKQIAGLPTEQKRYGIGTKLLAEWKWNDKTLRTGTE
jgi:hypothetical protein